MKKDYRIPPPYMVPHYRVLEQTVISNKGINEDLSRHLKLSEDVAVIKTAGVSGQPMRIGWVWYDVEQQSFGCELFCGNTFKEIRDEGSYFYYRQDIRSLAIAVQREHIISKNDDFLHVDRNLDGID